MALPLETHPLAVASHVVEGGFDLGKQFIGNDYSFKGTNWGEVGPNVVGGAVSGAIVGATGGASIVANAIIGDTVGGVTGNLVGGVVTRALDPASTSNNVLSGSNVSIDAVAGFVGGVVGHVAGSYVRIPKEPKPRMTSRRQFKMYSRNSDYFQKYGGYSEALVNQFVRAGVSSSISTHASNGLLDLIEESIFNGTPQQDPGPMTIVDCADMEGNPCR